MFYSCYRYTENVTSGRTKFYGKEKKLKNRLLTKQLRQHRLWCNT